MKMFIKSALLAALLAAVFGCATSGEKFETRLAPPDAFNPTFMLYKQMPGQKVMAVAVDPGGRWAFGFDHSKATLEEAETNALAKCNSAREDHKVFFTAKIFAINDEVVYYDEFK
jgi:hypothetical protein